ncbi:hypothetical protein KIW84_074204 [Lathyrus oleraceus]|uniref:Retroviral polymerase SH3-like domain-containing protein n=1 Tax=Pisum sativum TaxID=3888 RepID=A0A9D4VQV3_PEA|nr:hypothetical protein KIW84_074204 [Pisum sativum]
MGLDDAIYGTVRSNLLVTDPLPNLNRVYSTMIQEERVRMMTRTTEERKEVISLAIQTNGRAVKGRWDGKYKFMSCTHCHRAGHDAGSCFQLVGYPEWWGDRPKNEGKSGGRGKSLQQAGTGRGRGGIVRATVNVVHTGGTSAETGVSHEDGFGLAGISAEQLLSLIGFLNVHKANSNDKMIGSLCYAHNQRRDGDKFASRSKKCMFIGYPYGKKGWKLFDSETENIFVSRDVEFIETEFPFVVATTLRKDDLPNNWNFAESVHDAIDDIDEIDHTLSIQRSNDMGVENIRSVLDVGIEAGTSQYTNIDETMLSSTTSTTSTNEKVDD